MNPWSLFLSAEVQKYCMSLSWGYEDKTLHLPQAIKNNVLDIPKKSLATSIRKFLFRN